MVRELPLWMDHVESIRQARTELEQRQYNVILTDAHLPDGNWLDVLHLTRESPDQMEVIVTDPHADARFWAQVLNLGAYDLLAQPFSEPEVRRILSNACLRSEYGRPPVAAA
jgi:two-component system response regulator PilR (NtrC family)